MNAIGEMLVRQEPRRRHCETHGAYQSRNICRDIWTPCPRCSEEAEAKAQVERGKRERAEAMALWEKRLGHACIPVRFKDRRLESYIAETEGQRHALAFAEAYADNFDDVLRTGRSALLIGRPGTGKTHLAVGTALRIMARDGRTVLFIKVSDAIRRVTDTWGRCNGETETEAIAALTYPDLLILDEVGMQSGSNTEKRILFDFLDGRYAKRRPTLLLSNLDIDGVRASIGERVFDRLREDGGEVVVFDWTSYRGTT